MNSTLPDILVIGAGIAGASVAAELACTHRVVLLEREEVPGYHSTGRSAALFSESYGNAAVRALSRASRDFFYSPPQGFSAYPLVKRRGSLHVARTDQAKELDEFLALKDVAGLVRRVDAAEAVALTPVLRAEAVAAGGAFEAGSADVDVHALHQGYLKLFRHRGGTVLTGANVTALAYGGYSWTVVSSAGTFRARIVVNAAGAWADKVASLADILPMNIQPCRRTAVLTEPPDGMDPEPWPMTIGIDESYYFKPDAGLILISPADETPVEPCDVQPEELDVAVAVDRVEQATVLTIHRIRRKWAGLRSFAPDRSPVIGYDGAAPGFFWLAGQGGYGIQTAPGAALLAAALVREETLPDALKGFDPQSVAPRRFAGAYSRPVQR